MKSPPIAESLRAWNVSCSSLAGGILTKKKTRGDELSAIGKQTMAHAYSAMDYYFDHLKKDRRVGTVRRNGIRHEGESYAEKNIAATQEFIRELSYPRISRICFEFRSNSCGLNWKRSGNKPTVLARLYESGVRPNQEAVSVKVVHASLLRTRPWL
jgi:hypothetical protein